MKLHTLRSSLQGMPKTLQAINATTWRAGKTSTERGYGYKWQQARAQFLADNPLCAYCDAADRATTATVVDHKTPHQGDQKLFWRRSNWQPLCKACHDGRKAREEAAAGQRA